MSKSPTKDQAFFCDKAMKEATMDISPNAELIQLTFQDGSYMTILTGRTAHTGEPSTAGEFELEYEENIRTVCLEDDDAFVDRVIEHNEMLKRFKEAHNTDIATIAKESAGWKWKYEELEVITQLPLYQNLKTAEERIAQLEAQLNRALN